MQESEDDAWSRVAAEWSELWGHFAFPLWRAVAGTAGIGATTRVLDVGCGSGEFLAFAAGLGSTVAGIDPAPGMIALAGAKAPTADLREGSVEALPWPASQFDVVTAINALQFADDTRTALAEMARVTRPGGCVAVANWAEGRRNDINVIEAAVAALYEEEAAPDGELREPGGLERLVADAGLELLDAGIVELAWEASDDATLVRGILLGEDQAG
ncbi:MAG: SAM-dependent methyltransferase, partial [Microbacteriaceae bacterium]|nr:SAM-dependent methyltransferase [Microbacteriaceae bacterium]